MLIDVNRDRYFFRRYRSAGMQWVTNVDWDGD
jgi:hypothetical protein